MTHLEQSIILPYLNQFPILTYEDQFPIWMYLDHLPFWLISTGFLFWPFCTSLPFWLIWSDFYYLTHVDLFINRTPLDSVCNVTIFNLFSILIDLDQLAISSHSDRFIDFTYLDWSCWPVSQLDSFGQPWQCYHLTYLDLFIFLSHFNRFDILKHLDQFAILTHLDLLGAVWAAFAKINPFAQKHTVLSSLCQNKVISAITHSFQQLLPKSSYFG